MANFEAIYNTDLIYQSDCWKLCGDAHCCTFGRHKARFKLIGRMSAQELPLLPGEHEFLIESGLIDSFAEHSHRCVEFRFGDHRLMIESLVIKEAICACRHDARTTVCRLYPVLPVFDIGGRMIGIDKLGIYDQLEAMDGAASICQIKSVPLTELPKLLAIGQAIASDPRSLFYVTAYHLAQSHVIRQVEMFLQTVESGGRPDPFRAFETLLLRQKAINTGEFETELINLAERFTARYGDAFRL
ncbi:hypothetical protein SAMN05880561_105197 [Rhizobium sp. RU33A]|uniref:hypothetical protein n=1 Tax=Rhizobium sp. RU33A TaxID=1907413 RepID=UPI000953E887|nr:hypothetical protein [Rhizobium sp. RU33A]SIQ87609.1 hypothetical protein SAMN05880561_105197 [Rhizobium sp. RU33A]